MPTKNSSSVMLDVGVGRTSPASGTQPVQAQPDDPFRILILGDFSGRGQIQASSAWTGRSHRIDRDNFDEVMRRLDVQAALRLGTSAVVRLDFKQLADFEPDAIFERCEAFRSAAPPPQENAPRESARRTIPRAPEADVESDVARLTSGSLLDDILEQADAPSGAPRRSSDELQAVIERVVAPHLEPKESDAAKEIRASHEEARAVLMRAILHHPAFQALESAWRAVDLLARGLDTEGGLTLHVTDVSKSELARDLNEDRGVLRRLLVEETVGTPGGEPWAVVIGNYVFDHSAEDVSLLEKLGGLARAAGAPFLAESAPPGEDTAAAERAWLALRAKPEAGWIGLALPRFLARLPYGRDLQAIDSFPFEEMPGRPNHSDFLWANPAFACALLLGRSFNEHGWSFRPGIERQIEGLPYYTFERDGETQAQPCGEVLLTDSEIDSLHEQGVMALASIRNRDAVVLVRFQSIADPLASLAGRWRG